MSMIAFRMDDICPGMDRRKFERFQRLFSAFDVRPLIGIVPENRDPSLVVDEPQPDFWERMRTLKARGWTISQHGYEHRYVTKDGGLLGINRASEFASLPYAEQLGKLRAGKVILKQQGLDTDIFMAPSHSYDIRTLDALLEAGFTTVTDGYAPFIYRWRSLKFIPCQLGRPKKIPPGSKPFASMPTPPRTICWGHSRGLSLRKGVISWISRICCAKRA
jgi:predicted deacetylase